jgi:hypothetical protein
LFQIGTKLVLFGLTKDSNNLKLLIDSARHELPSSPIPDARRASRAAYFSASPGKQSEELAMKNSSRDSADESDRSGAECTEPGRAGIPDVCRAQKREIPGDELKARSLDGRTGVSHRRPREIEGADDRTATRARECIRVAECRPAVLVDR